MISTSPTLQDDEQRDSYKSIEKSRDSDPNILSLSRSSGGPQTTANVPQTGSHQTVPEDPVPLVTIDGPSASRGRLECTRIDTDGGCRMWLLNPKGFTLRLAAVSPKLRF